MKTTVEKVIIWCPVCEAQFYVKPQGEDELYGCPHCMALMVLRDGQPVLDEDIKD